MNIELENGDSHRVEDIWGETYWIDHIEVWFDHIIGVDGDWCADAVDEKGDYIPQTAEWSATRKLAIERSLFNFPNVDIQVFSKTYRRKLWTIKGAK